MTQPALPKSTFLSRLLRDRSGNTLALVAAATAPLVAMVGSAVDIGRGYVTQSRLQQACDSGVLAARKKLGSDLPPSGQVLGQVRKVGNEMFDLNFPAGRYDTEDRAFVMTLEEDFSISGTASAVLPTAIMGIFGKQTIPVNVSCQSRMNFTNLDIMMVLDVTGSMRNTNAGDAMPRIDVMRSVIKGFHGNIEASKAPDTRVRYGFVPYSVNVNVAGILPNNWVAKDWIYQSRTEGFSSTETDTDIDYRNWEYVSGDRSEWAELNRYDATRNEVAGGGGGGDDDDDDDDGYDGYTWFSCNGTEPDDTIVQNDTELNRVTENEVGPPAVQRTIQYMERISNGTRYRTRLSGETCIVESETDTNFRETYERVEEIEQDEEYTYKPVAFNVPNWKNVSSCLEELPTYEITDYGSVDLTRALDLNIDHVPSPGMPTTQWKPQNPEVIYGRSMFNSGSGSWTTEEVVTDKTFIGPGDWWQSTCPSAGASKLEELTAGEIDSYLGTLEPLGATYHDIGMIWGARMLSPDGIFASDNVDVSGNKPTTRHMIFLTDGQTEPYDVSYGAYGLEPLDRRRWDPATSTNSLLETVEARFRFACAEIKKKNTTVWVIAFGTTVNASMTECAGPGHYFEAQNASELDNAFASIARSMGDLRVSK